MDWAKAKNVFIIIFIVINIFLLVNIIDFKMNEGISSETISDTVKIMKERDVMLECSIPNKKVNTLALTYENFGLDKKKVINRLIGKDADGDKITDGSKKLSFMGSDTFTYEDLSPSENMNSLDSKNVEKYVKDIIKSIGLPASEYVIDSFVKNTDGSISVKLLEEYMDFLIYDNYIDVTVAKNGIVFMQCRYRQIKNKKTPGGDVVSAYLALLENFPEGSNEVITGIDMGYMEYKDKDSMNIGNVWRVKLKDKKPRYFKANSGEEIEM